MFENCPHTLTIHVGRGESTARLELDITATDNADQPPSVTCDLAADMLPIGTHSVHCLAEDAAGNAAECDFEVEVIGE